MKCYAYNIEKGCTALQYTPNDLESGCCEKCKFFKTPQQRIIEKYKEPSRINRFVLVVDSQGQGMFKSIKDIDDRLKEYYEANKEEENANAKLDSYFIDDYNLMFENHKIQIIPM